MQWRGRARFTKCDVAARACCRSSSAAPRAALRVLGTADSCCVRNVHAARCCAAGSAPAGGQHAPHLWHECVILPRLRDEHHHHLSAATTPRGESAHVRGAARSQHSAPSAASVAARSVCCTPLHTLQRGRGNMPGSTRSRAAQRHASACRAPVTVMTKLTHLWDVAPAARQQLQQPIKRAAVRLPRRHDGRQLRARAEPRHTHTA
jgi:hypothetical protein